MVIANAQSESQSELANAMGKKKRMSSLFSRDLNPNEHGPSISSLLMYASPKPKDKRRPILTMTNVTQAFAVYPERPELISRSTLIKVEGLLGSEDTAAAMRSREGWLLIMPELEGGLAPSAEMLKWVVGEIFLSLINTYTLAHFRLARCFSTLRPSSSLDMGSSRSSLINVCLSSRAFKRCKWYFCGRVLMLIAC